jgi:thymidylate kinase
VFVFLDVPEEVCRARLLGENSRNRFDDIPGKIATRFVEFERTFSGIQERLGDKLVRIDGDRPKTEVAADIRVALTKLQLQTR